jgi:exopolysaccharide biosynthesis polyprenyl glycosylphosphotransferase
VSSGSAAGRGSLPEAAAPGAGFKDTALPHWGLRLSERRVLLLAGDVLCASLGLLLALWLWTLTSGARFSLDYLASKAIWYALLVPGWLLLNSSLYDLRRAAFWSTTLAGLLSAAGVGLVLYGLIYFLAPLGLLPRLVVLYFVVATVALGWAWRLVYIRVFVSTHFQRRALVIGAGWAGRAIIHALSEFQGWHYSVVGLIDDDPQKRGQTVEGVPVLGGHEQLLATAHAAQASELILAVTGPVRGELFQALLDCQTHGYPVVRVLSLYEQITGRVPIEHLEADWLVTSFMDRVRLDSFFVVAQRLLDLAGGLLGLALLLLVLPPVALAIRLESRGPIFYRQMRAGRGGRPFRVLKFRTMIDQAEADGHARWATAGDERVTRVGRFLRRARLDELPQVWNVLRGDMSLVGPRPERPELITLLEQQIPFYRARLLVKPGLTGWAQINYGYGRSVDDAQVKLEYDLYYIEHQSLWLELIILFRTITVVLGMKGS